MPTSLTTSAWSRHRTRLPDGGESVVPQELPQAPSEDEQFEAYMAAHFPGRA